MKNKGITAIFVIVCIAVLFAAYGIGLCIRKVRFRQAVVTSKTNLQQQTQVSAETKKPGNEIKPAEPVSEPVENVQASSEDRPAPGPGNEGRMRLGGGDLSDEERAQMRDRFQNMSDEERQQFRDQMRQRFGGDRQFSGRRSGRGQQQNEPNE
jgi:hypothetical protein